MIMTLDWGDFHTIMSRKRQVNASGVLKISATASPMPTQEVQVSPRKRQVASAGSYHAALSSSTPSSPSETRQETEKFRVSVRFQTHEVLQKRMPREIAP